MRKKNLSLKTRVWQEIFVENMQNNGNDGYSIRYHDTWISKGWGGGHFRYHDMWILEGWGGGHFRNHDMWILGGWGGGHLAK